MDAWAVSYGDTAAFVCVSCAGPQLATQFGTELKLSHCHNTWVEEDDMPTWGQLGCNGFILLDGAHNVVCKASSPYLQVRERAFRHVETLLGALVAPPVATGTAVRLVGLVKRPDLNGTVGKVAPGGGAGGRCLVVLADGSSVSLKPDNFEVVGGEGGGGVGVGSKRALNAEEESAGAGAGSAGAGAELPSVKVDVLDEEHARCEAALAALATKGDGAAAREVLEAYEEHFAHEERLLDTHLYAGVDSACGFSADRGARTSHYADHARMLDALRALVGAQTIAAETIDAICRDFHKHATEYDVNYADRLSAALATAH